MGPATSAEFKGDLPACSPPSSPSGSSNAMTSPPSTVNGDKIRQFPGSLDGGAPPVDTGHRLQSPSLVRPNLTEKRKVGKSEERKKDKALFTLLQVSIDTASADLGMPLGHKRSDLG